MKDSLYNQMIIKMIKDCGIVRLVKRIETLIINTKCSHIKSAAHIQNEVLSRKNNNLTDKTCSYNNPDVEQVNNLNKRVTDECAQHFYRYKYKCEFVVKLNHATHGNKNFFALKKRFKNKHKKLNEASELSHQIDEFEQRGSGYIIDSIKKLTAKMFRYHDKRASSYCKLPKSFCSSKSL